MCYIDRACGRMFALKPDDIPGWQLERPVSVYRLINCYVLVKLGSGSGDTCQAVLVSVWIMAGKKNLITVIDVLLDRRPCWICDSNCGKIQKHSYINEGVIAARG